MQHLAENRQKSVLPGRGNKALRQLDRYVGIPFVLALAGLRRRRRFPSSAHRIGLLNTAAIGDMILMSGPLADLREAYSSAEITLLAGPSNYEAACLLKGLDRVVQLPVFNPLGAVVEIRRIRFDLLMDFGSWARLNAILASVSGAHFTVGFRTPWQCRHYGYDLCVEHLPFVHELENYRRIVTAVGVRVRHAPRIDLAGIPTFRGTAPTSPYVVFHLWPGGTRSELKQWPVMRWIQLAHHMLNQGLDVVLTGGPSQRALNDSVIRAAGPAHRSRMHNRAGVSLAATATLVSGARLVVSVDTGVMHLAAAIDSPLVALMGPACSNRWGPISEYAVAIDSPSDAAGYLNLGFEAPLSSERCMEAISLDAVRRLCDESLCTGRELRDAELR